MLEFWLGSSNSVFCVLCSAFHPRPYWLLGTGYWVLGTGYRVLGTGYRVLLSIRRPYPAGSLVHYEKIDHYIFLILDLDLKIGFPVLDFACCEFRFAEKIRHKLLYFLHRIHLTTRTVPTPPGSLAVPAVGSHVAALAVHHGTVSYTHLRAHET